MLRRSAAVQCTCGSYFACLLGGGAAQFAFFLVAFSVDYYNFFFKNYRPEVYFTCSFAVACMIGVMLTIRWPYWKSYKITITVCFCATAVVVALVPVFVELLYREIITEGAAFAIVCTNLFVLGVTASTAGGSFYSFIGDKLDPWSISAAQAGTTWGGVFMYVIRIVSKLIFPEDSTNTAQLKTSFRWSGVLQYVAVACYLVFACASVWHLETLSIRAKKSRSLEINSSPDEMGLLDSRPAQAKISEVWKRTWAPLLNVTLVITLTLVFYPGILSLIRGASYGWFVVILFGSFAVADAIGSTLPTWCNVYNNKTYWAGLLLHVLLILPMAMALQRKWGQEFFTNDYFLWTLTGLFGFNCGYSSCTSMVILVTAEPSQSGKRIASNMALCSLRFGTLVGALISIILNLTVLKNITTPPPS